MIQRSLLSASQNDTPILLTLPLPNPCASCANATPCPTDYVVHQPLAFPSFNTSCNSSSRSCPGGYVLSVQKTHTKPPLSPGHHLGGKPRWLPATRTWAQRPVSTLSHDKTVTKSTWAQNLCSGRSSAEPLLAGHSSGHAMFIIIMIPNLPSLSLRSRIAKAR